MKTFATIALSALVLAGCAKTEEAAAPVEAEAAVTETAAVPAAN